MHYMFKFNKSTKLNSLVISVLLIGFTPSVWAQGSTGAPDVQPTDKGPAGGPPGGPPNVPPG
jgi:hypothetical protein